MEPVLESVWENFWASTHRHENESANVWQNMPKLNGNSEQSRTIFREHNGEIINALRRLEMLLSLDPRQDDRCMAKVCGNQEAQVNTGSVSDEIKGSQIKKNYRGVRRL